MICVVLWRAVHGVGGEIDDIQMREGSTVVVVKILMDLGVWVEDEGLDKKEKRHQVTKGSLKQTLIHVGAASIQHQFIITNFPLPPYMQPRQKPVKPTTPFDICITSPSTFKQGSRVCRGGRSRR